VLILEDLGADFEEARGGVDDAVVVVLAGGETCGDEERLDRGAGSKMSVAARLR